MRPLHFSFSLATLVAFIAANTLSVPLAAQNADAPVIANPSAQTVAPSALPTSVSSQPATPGPKSAAESAFNALGTANLESNTLLAIINKAFNTDSDAFNPEDGTLTWKGHSYDLGHMRAFRARFERYLAQPESIDNDVYRGLLGEIFNLLSTRGGEVAGENTKKAWQLLYRACEFEADGGASLTVANQIFNAWRIRDERDALAITQLELERLRRQQQASVSYATDSMVRSAAKKADEEKKEASVSNKLADQNPANKPEENPTENLFRVRELAETEAKIKAAATSSALTGLEAKLQFQTALVNLFLQRRFQHCLIAASFYRFIFKGTAQNLEVGKKEIQTFLPSSDLPVTVETIEFLSREAINDTESAMQAVAANYDEGQHVGALERLQETFFLGEFLPAVAQFERPKKQTLLKLYQRIATARKLADLKDYDAVDKLVAEIGVGAKDFRNAEVSSALRAAQRMSTLALYAGQQAASAGDFIRAQEGVARAAALWPLNPAIKTYSENMASQVDLGSQAAVLFDDAMKRGDLRRVYDQRSELAIALLSDAVRSPRLKETIETLSRVEIFLAQAQELVAQNNAFAAWEALEAATRLTPADVIVNQRRAELAPRVAAFVGRLDAARRHEEGGSEAAALTQYLAAQGLYPASSIARQGIARVGGKLLADLAQENPAAPPAAPK